jgi:hypothetical protein
MKKNILLKLLASVLILTAITSCRKERVVGGTEVQSLSGQWWVTTVGSDGSKSGYYALNTFNTSANVPTEMWIDDGNNYYGLHAKIATNASAQTFTANAADELYYGVKVTITDGKVLNGVAKGPDSKAVTDSIYFKATFTGDPVVYTYSGYKRTGFVKDDH